MKRIVLSISVHPRCFLYKWCERRDGALKVTIYLMSISEINIQIWAMNLKVIDALIPRSFLVDRMTPTSLYPSLFRWMSILQRVKHST